MSENLSEERRKRIADFLNQIETDNKNNDEILKVVSEIRTEIDSKIYGLVWEKHAEDVDKMLKTHLPVFKEWEEKEIKEKKNLESNFIIEGDNLHSLYLLNKTHKEAFDIIYIDPPYNTGSKFNYDDKKIEITDRYRHSLWLSFMERRLRAALPLMKSKSLFLVSIDDHEHANLKLLCDDIFGETNFITSFVWQKKKGGGQATHVYEGHEYILCYAKDFNEIGKLVVKDDSFDIDKNTVEIDGKKYRVNDDFIRAKFGKYNKGEERRCYYEDLLEIKGQKKYDEVQEKLKSGEYILKPAASDSKKHYICKLENVTDGKTKVIYSIISGVRTEDGNNEIEEMGLEFDNPKPLALIKKIIDLLHIKDAKILDFFAGSGTTGHAVLELNEEDGGNRSFVLCTNNEVDDDKKIKYFVEKGLLSEPPDRQQKKAYAEWILKYREFLKTEKAEREVLSDSFQKLGICQATTYPRIRTVITGKKIDGSKYREKISSNLKYYKTGFLDKNSETFIDDLFLHIKEMVQLQHQIKVDNKNYVLILSDLDADHIEKNWKDYEDSLKGIYISRNVLLTQSQNKLFKKVKIEIIPDCYFDQELKEVGETW